MHEITRGCITRDVALDVERGVGQIERDTGVAGLREMVERFAGFIDLAIALRREPRDSVGARKLAVQVVEAAILEINHDNVIDWSEGRVGRGAGDCRVLRARRALMAASREQVREGREHHSTASEDPSHVRLSRRRTITAPAAIVRNDKSCPMLNGPSTKPSCASGWRANSRRKRNTP